MERGEKIDFLYVAFAAFLALALMGLPFFIGDKHLLVAWFCVVGGFIFALASLLGALFLIKKEKKMIPLWGMAICGVGFIGFVAWYLWPMVLASDATSKTAESHKVSAPLSMRDIFDSDFPDLAKVSIARSASLQPDNIYFVYTEYFDIPTNSYFLAIYFDRPLVYRAFVSLLASKIKHLIADLGQAGFKVTQPGDSRLITNTTMRFSGQVFLYIDGKMDISDMAAVEACYGKFGMTVSIRDDDYRIPRSREFGRTVSRAIPSSPTIRLPKGEDGMNVEIQNNIGTAPDWEMYIPNEDQPCPEPSK